MENKSQIEILAKTALQTNNYSQAYNYYSQLLETDINNKEFWKGKAFAAGHLSSLDEMKINETITYVKTLMSIQELTESEKSEIALELVDIARKKIFEGLKHVESEIDKEFNAIQIPPGTLLAIHQMRKTPIQMRLGNKYQAPLKELFHLFVFACELNPTTDNYDKLIKVTNLALLYSSRNIDYLGKLYDGSEISNIWEDADRKLKVLDPNYITDKKSSGCFIATATTGDYNHPTVMQLRLFRDNTLETYNWGRAFIKFYYRNSPPIADYISQKTILKKLLYFSFIKPLSVLTKLITK